MKKNYTTVLYVSYDGLTDPLGQSQIIPYLAGLSSDTFRFHIISFEKQDRFSNNRHHISEILDKHKIIWHPLVYTATPPVISTIKDIRTLLKKSRELHKEYHFSIVHCRSYIASFAGLLLKKKYKVPFIFDMRGFWPDERVEGGLWKLNNPVYKMVYRYFKRKEKEYIHNADFIISLTNSGKNILQHNFTETKKELNIEVIPCCADTALFNRKHIKHEEKEKLKQKLGIQRADYIISYSGSVGTWYMLDEMLAFFNVLLKRKPTARFLFITPDDAGFILSKAQQLGIPFDKIIISHAQRKEMPLFLSLSDISLFFIRPVFSKKASSPTKMAEIMSLGLPFICNSNVGDVDMIAKNSAYAFAVKDFSDNHYLEAVSKIESVVMVSPELIREDAIKYFSLEKGVASYKEVYQKVLKLTQ
jgi:glycosyltransferase involved in cell wall biosynthesis